MTEKSSNPQNKSLLTLIADDSFTWIDFSTSIPKQLYIEECEMMVGLITYTNVNTAGKDKLNPINAMLTLLTPIYLTRLL